MQVFDLGLIDKGRLHAGKAFCGLLGRHLSTRNEFVERGLPLGHFLINFNVAEGFGVSLNFHQVFVEFFKRVGFKSVGVVVLQLYDFRSRQASSLAQLLNFTLFLVEGIALFCRVTVKSIDFFAELLNLLAGISYFVEAFPLVLVVETADGVSMRIAKGPTMCTQK